MEADNLKILLGKYYSGDIMPEEYQSLLSALKENHKLTPELEKERKMLLAIELCEFVEPKGFEDKLIMAIDRRSNSRRHNMLRMVLSGSAAAIILATITIGVIFHNKNSVEQSQPIAKVPVTHSTVVARETIETDAPDNTMQVVSIAQNKHQSNPISDEELEKSVQVADNAMIDVLTSVKIAKNEVIETIDNIEISQTTDYNIM